MNIQRQVLREIITNKNILSLRKGNLIGTTIYTICLSDANGGIINHSTSYDFPTALNIYNIWMLAIVGQSDEVDVVETDEVVIPEE